MLTMDILSQNDVLKALPKETLQVIELMSKNDEAKVIAAKTIEVEKATKTEIVKEIYQNIDKDIEEITGKKRDASQKTYDYLKQELGAAFKAVGEVEALKKKVEGGKIDEAKESQYKQQIADAKNKADQLQGLLDKNKTDFEKQIAGLSKANEQQILSTSFATEHTQLVFKDSLDKKLLKETIENRKAKLVAEVTTSSIEDDQGNKVTVLRGKDKQILLNPNNGMKPFTAGEFYRHTMNDLLDISKQQNGGGGTPPGGGGGKTTKHSIDFSGVKSKVQFHAQLDTHLTKLGIARTSPDFDTTRREIINENQDTLNGLKVTVEGDSNV